MIGSISPTVELKGSITPSVILIGAIKDIAGLTASIHMSDNLIGTVSISESYDHYSGDYEVSPDANTSVSLNTSGKLMDSDVKVLKIPYWETSNVSGKTVYIASEPQISFS